MTLDEYVIKFDESACKSISQTCSEDGATEFLNEPLLGLFLADLLEVSEGAGSRSSSGDSIAGSGKDNVEVHTVDTSGWVVLNTEIDVLINTETEVAYIVRDLSIAYPDRRSSSF